MLHEAIFLATCLATRTTEKHCKLQRGCHTFAIFFFATCNSPPGNCLQLFLRQLDFFCEQKTGFDCLIVSQNCVAGCDGHTTQSNLSRNVGKVEDISTFLATRNATFCCRCRLQNWGVTREIFLATCLARQVARKIASCNMALSRNVWFV